MSLGELCVAQAPAAIGKELIGQGGIYVGLMRGRDGAPDYHLIVGPELTPSAWGVAVEAASQLEIDRHSDFTLPFRAEQALLFANVPELFKKDWYWSCEQHVSLPDCAWMQHFSMAARASATRVARTVLVPSAD